MNANRKPDGSQVFHVTEAEVGLTLVTALKRWLGDLSWNQTRRVLSGRRVQVNGNLSLDEGRRLTAGEVVKVFAQALAAPPREDDVRIVFLDQHLVIIEKPAGMTTLRHSEELTWNSRRKQLQPTVDEVLPRVIARYIDREQRGRSPASRSSERHPFPGPSERRGRRDNSPTKPQPVRPVHRLDRDTSGLMVFARTVAAERGLVQLFRRHDIHRVYRAIVQGQVTARTIHSRLVRDRGDGRRGSTNLPDVGQEAITHVRPLEDLGRYTLIECRLETGRTHQIRIHLSELGHFVCGDKVYSQPLFKKPLVDRSGAPRLALHAAELGFVHPITGAKLRFEQPLPRDLRDLLERLRATRPKTKQASDQAEEMPELPES